MSPENFPKSIYMTSADPFMHQHEETYELAKQDLKESIPLIIVNNEAKGKNRMFTPQESLKLFKTLYPHSQIEIFTLETRERIAEYIQHAEHIVRRKEVGLSSDSPYIQKIADFFEDPTYPQKIHWVDVHKKIPNNHTSGRLKALVYVAENHEDNRVKDLCNEQALKIAPSIIVEAVRKKIQEYPDKRFFLSLTPDLQEFFEDIQKERQTADVLL